MTSSPSRSTRILTGLATLLLVLSAFFGLFLLGGAAFGYGPSGREVAVHTPVDIDRLQGLPRNTVGPDHLDATVRVRHATTEQRRWAALRDLPIGVIFIAGVWLLRAVLLSVRDGDPFTPRTVTRLRALAGVVLIGGPIAFALRSVFETQLAQTAQLPGTGLELTIPGNALLGGLALFVLAEVFAQGVRLRDDLEGTV